MTVRYKLTLLFSALIGWPGAFAQESKVVVSQSSGAEQSVSQNVFLLNDYSFVLGTLGGIDDQGQVTFIVDGVKQARVLGPRQLVAMIPVHWNFVSGTVSNTKQTRRNITSTSGRTAAVSLGTLTDVNSPTPGDSAGSILCVDGQYFPGVIDADDENISKETIRWQSKSIGVLSVPLTLCRTVRLSGTRTIGFDDYTVASGANSQNDVIQLINGDMMSGFIDSAGAIVTIETSPGKPVEVERERIAAMRFANPPQEREGMWVWLSDGTVMRINSLVSTPGENNIVTSSILEAPRSLSRMEIKSFVPAAERILPLCMLQSKTIADSGRRWTPPLAKSRATSTALGAEDIYLSGPLGVEFAVPAGAERFITNVSIPASGRAWGDCNVSIDWLTSNGEVRPLWRSRMNQSNPLAQINTPINDTGAGILRVRIEEGENGPIHDNIILHHGIIVRGTL